MEYLLVFFLLFFPLVYIARKDTPARSLAWTLIFLLLFYFSAFRLGVGRDFVVYKLGYDPSSLSFENFEPLWRYSIIGLRSLGVDYFGFQGIVVALTLFFFFNGFCRLSLDPALSILSFVVIFWGYFETMNAVRQCLAMAFVLSFFDLFVQKKYKTFLLVVIIGFAIHHSAAFVLPMAMLLKWHYKPILLYVLILVSLLFGGWLVAKISMWAYPYLPERYSFYLVNIFYFLEKNTGMYQIFINAVAMYFVGQYETMRRLHRPTSYYIIALVLAVLIYNATLAIAPLSRLLSYPLMLIFILIPNSFMLIKERYNREIIGAILLIFFLFSVKILMLPEEPYSHFKTIFHQISLS